MKKSIVFLIAMVICSQSFSQKKKDVIAEINGYYKTVVSNATYNVSQKEVWTAMYAVVMERYPNLVRESESKGYVDAKFETSEYQSRINAEIRGDEKPYRVVFTLESESRGWDVQNNTYFPWVKNTNYDAMSILKVQVRLYEMLNGPIPLPENLQAKIDKYNLTQKKDKNKVIKGKDY